MFTVCVLAVWNLSLLYLSVWGSSGRVLWTRVLQSMLGRVGPFFQSKCHCLFMYEHFCINSPVCVLGICFRFLNVKIQEGDAHNIFCPAYECYQLVPVHVIESVVSREMDQRYLQFDIKVKIAHHTLVRCAIKAHHSFRKNFYCSNLCPMFFFLIASCSFCFSPSSPSSL